MEISLGFHCVWMFIAISALLFCYLSVNFKYLKIVISIFMYTCILMVIFDVSMAIVYLAHIQQSLTIEMVLRHAGWAVGMKVDDPQEFAGWIPMLASVMWLRCIVFLTGNILFIRRIWHIRKKIKKKEVQKKHNKKNPPIPEPQSGIREDPTKNTFVVHA
ncbi:hypothetical protein O0L34_g5676 [Tuta absoluta]|nr:hypothetical protein O0L34_g5676 [Tuta absoluta]